MSSNNISSNGRRDFIKKSAVAVAGLVIGIDSVARTYNISGGVTNNGPIEINPFILIDANNTITIINPRNDMGQGTIHSVPAMIAEELNVTLDMVTIIQSDGKSKYGAQTSGGSSSIRNLWLPLRKAGAATRQMLIEAAAKRWNVQESDCVALDGKISRRGSTASFTYGELAEEASKFDVPTEPMLKMKSEFRIIGKDLKRKELPARTNGTAVYGIDVDVPGMLYASIFHASMIYGKVSSIDDSESLKVPGVLQVIKCERKMIHRDVDSVAVIATNWWAAHKGRSVLKIKWDTTGLEEKIDTDRYFRTCYESVNKEGVNHAEKGDFKRQFEASQTKLDLTYQTPFLSHCPIEPENTTAHVKDDGTVEIWAPIQGPGETLPDVANYLGIATEKIKIHPMLMGGSYGRKAYIDFVKEACFLSNKLKKPVKVIWNREDDLSQGPYRTGMVSHMQGFVEQGKVTGFHHHIIGESILRQVFNGLAENEPDPWMGEALEENSYQFKTAKVSFSNIKTEIPIMWWRSVNASNLSWGQECFIDELAQMAGKDPLTLRRELFEDQRFIKVLTTLAEKSGYYEKSAAGSGKGVAIFKSFGSIVACCITVSKAGDGVTIDKVVSVIDCGMYVSPDTVKAQCEGNIVMGLSAAIKGGITFEQGICKQNNFNTYHVLRINEMPKIEVHTMENDEQPGGVGEPGLPPVAPALGNAIFAATGVRLRNLPIDIKTLKQIMK